MQRTTCGRLVGAICVVSDVRAKWEGSEGMIIMRESDERACIPAQKGNSELSCSLIRRCLIRRTKKKSPSLPFSDEIVAHAFRDRVFD